MKGMTARQLAKWRERNLTDNCIVKVQTGTQANGKKAWETVSLPSVPCKLIERNGINRTGNGVIQSFDAEIQLGGEYPLQTPGKTYQLTVEVFKPASDWMDPNTPEVARIRVFDVVTVDTLRDMGGGEGLQVVRVKNAEGN